MIEAAFSDDGVQQQQHQVMNYYLRCLRSTFGASRHPRRSLRFPNQFDVFSKRQSYFHMKITFSIFVDVEDERRGFVRKRLPNVNNFFSCSPLFSLAPRQNIILNKRQAGRLLFSIIFVVLRRKLSSRSE